MQISWRYLVVAAGQDLSLFVVWSVIPLWARIDTKASPLALGAIPVSSGIAYMLASPVAGRLSDRVSRTTLARIGLFLYATFCALASQAESIGWIYLVAPLGGIANALVWPALQAQISDESGPNDLERNLGTFSLSWGVGKTLGFFLGGLAYANFGISATLGCSALSLLLIALVPSRPATHVAQPKRLVADGGPSHAVRVAYLRSAWIANFGAYGLGAILNFLYEDTVISLGREPYEYNLVLGTVFLAQTVAFWAFGRFSGWRYRAAAFLAWQAIGAAALLIVGLGAPLGLALPAAALVGTSTGLGYAASIYYSVHSDESRGHRAGIHEAVLGASNFSIPLAGGALQRTSGWAGAPYALGTAIVAVTIAIQVRVLRRAQRTG